MTPKLAEIEITLQNYLAQPCRRQIQQAVGQPL
jgi:hypothetical protein